VTDHVPTGLPTTLVGNQSAQMGLKHQKIMTLLSKIAEHTEPVANARIAAALLYKNEIVAIGSNRRKTHPFQALYGRNKDSIYLHAEIDCIKNSLKHIEATQLAKCSLYVCRVKFDGPMHRRMVYGLAKPCQGCTRAIVNFDIKTIYFSCDDNTIMQL
jgi:tRNA(Arg) A34 adenosine deaminase TadA